MSTVGRTSSLVVIALAMALAVALPTARSLALTYECVDAAGKIIFTDSPSQLKFCATATTSAPSPHTPPPQLSALSPQSAQATPAVSPVPGQIVIPVTKIGRSLVVRAKLNETREARLIVDTGAEVTVLSHAAAMDAGLLPSQAVATVTLNTAGGSVRADVFRVGSVSLGEAEARNVTAAVHDLPDAPAGVDGLLGLTFLDQFLVTLDAKKGELHLKPR